MSDNLILTLIVFFYFSPLLYHLRIVISEYRKDNKVPLKKFKRILKYSFIFMIPLAVGFAILTHTNFLDYESPKTYDQFDEITFENFRGLEFFKKSLYGNERFAYVVTSIESKMDDNSVTVHSLFYPSRSFVYKKNTNSEELLRHEKYHIKITELFARKARKELSELKYFNEDKIESVLASIRLKERNFQKEYDYDTFHSYVYREQKRYEETVDSLLTLLNDFKNPKISFHAKK